MSRLSRENKIIIKKSNLISRQMISANNTCLKVLDTELGMGNVNALLASAVNALSVSVDKRQRMLRVGGKYETLGMPMRESGGRWLKRLLWLIGCSTRISAAVILRHTYGDDLYSGSLRHAIEE
jgi:hypothetical protein